MKRWLVFIIFSFVFFSAIPLLYCSSKKAEEKPAEEPAFKVPSGVPKKITVFSNLNISSISPILEFINSKTGLRCSLNEKSGKSYLPEGNYDIFIGLCVKDRSIKIYNYNSQTWDAVPAKYHKSGIYTWSKWYSCLAVNSVIAEGFTIHRSNILKRLIGKVTAANPVNDLHTLAVLNTLYQAYGPEILIEINNSIPLYMETREDLIFSIESGQYSGAIAIDGYFRDSINKGYPVGIFYESFIIEKYPVTTVSGTNAAFIPEASSNREGAGYVIDFMAGVTFQTFIANTYYTPVLAVNGEDEGKSQFPPEPQKTLLFECSSSWMDALKKKWENIISPEGLEDIPE